MGYDMPHRAVIFLPVMFLPFIPTPFSTESLTTVEAVLRKKTPDPLGASFCCQVFYDVLIHGVKKLLVRKE